MNTKIPAYLYEKSNIVRLILLTATFALLFINIFQPFGSRGWYPHISDFKYFFFSSLIILTGMLVVVVSRLIMLAYTKKNDLYLCSIRYSQNIFLKKVLTGIFLKFSVSLQLIQAWYFCSLTLFCGCIFRGAIKITCSKN